MTENTMQIRTAAPFYSERLSSLRKAFYSNAFTFGAMLRDDDCSEHEIEGALYIITRTGGFGTDEPTKTRRNQEDRG